jgi:4-hydroxy-2-oxoheptanedioate aldolase
MKLKSNHLKKTLKEGGVCFGTMLRILKSPQAVALCASQGWDYIIMDTEHNDFNTETLANCSLVAKYEKMTLLVRVPDKQYHLMAQTLDIGSEGLVLPQVKTKKETEMIIQSTKYAPMGNRGVSISEVVTRFRNQGHVEYMEWANDELLTVVQIESREGVDNIEDIVSTKGVDAIMIGPADLSQDMGIPGQLQHPELENAFRKIIKACKKTNVAPGIHLANMELANKWTREGMRFVTYSYDIKFFKESSRTALKSLRSNLKNV